MRPGGQEWIADVIWGEGRSDGIVGEAIIGRKLSVTYGRKLAKENRRKIKPCGRRHATKVGRRGRQNALTGRLRNTTFFLSSRDSETNESGAGCFCICPWTSSDRSVGVAPRIRACVFVAPDNRCGCVPLRRSASSALHIGRSIYS